MLAENGADKLATDALKLTGVDLVIDGGYTL